MKHIKRLLSTDKTAKNFDNSQYFVEDNKFHVDEEIRSVIAWDDMLITGGNNGTLRAWNLRGEIKNTQAHTSIARVLIVWGQFFVSGSYDKSIVVWKSPFVEHKRVEMAHHSWIYCFAIWNTNLISGSQSDVKIWNQQMETISSVAIDAFQIKVVNQDFVFIAGKTLSLWTGDTSEPVQRIDYIPSADTIWAVMNYKDGFIFGDSGKVKKLMISGTKCSVLEFDGEHSTPIWALGTWNFAVISGSKDTLMIHKPDGTLLAKWIAHADWIRHAIRFQRRLVTVGDDGHIIFWEGNVVEWNETDDFQQGVIGRSLDCSTLL